MNEKIKIVARYFDLTTRNLKLIKWKCIDKDVTPVKLTLKIKNHDVYSKILANMPEYEAELLEERGKDGERFVNVECLLLTIEKGYIIDIEKYKEKVKAFSGWHYCH